MVQPFLGRHLLVQLELQTTTLKSVQMVALGSWSQLFQLHNFQSMLQSLMQLDGLHSEFQLFIQMDKQSSETLF